MSDNIIPALFDIGAVLQGRNYPEGEVVFFLDERLALEIAHDTGRLTELALLGKTEEHDALEVAIDEKRAQLRSQAYRVHLRGIPNKVRQDILAKAYEKYPRKRDFLGNEEPDDDRDSLFTTLLWNAMITRIEAPDGAVQPAPSLETIQQLRDYAPIASLDAISEKVRELTVGAKAGFESVTQDTDFLSQP